VDYINSDRASAAANGNAKADQALGAAKNKLAEWSRLNPNASGADFERKLKEIGGEHVLEVLKAAKKTPPPSRDSSTSMVPKGIKTSAFGYPDDPTPDSNSRKGVAAFTTKKDADGSRNSPTRLVPGDIAVSPDVEKKLISAGVKPRDTITVKLADGTEHKGRWMDRTADYLTGRIDIYSPNGVPKNDGTQVVGWSL
jgi:hypothetical protein